ncbi:MAG: hypothetical protein JNL87_09700 [Burkholderiaceae bacterium]|nr:hypothetical protein [Burkholderiaceae bacterium]
MDLLRVGIDRLERRSSDGRRPIGRCDPCAALAELIQAVSLHAAAAGSTSTMPLAGFVDRRASARRRQPLARAVGRPEQDVEDRPRIAAGAARGGRAGGEHASSARQVKVSSVSSK